MGGAAIKVTCEACGALKSIEVAESVDGLSCTGTAEFEGVDAAKALFDKYDGVDMGLGTVLEFTPLP